MTVAAQRCADCGTPILNSQARNCSHCGTALPMSPGTIIGGQYNIVRSIKSGGSGSLYLAEDLRTFNRRCVVKRLHSTTDPALRGRFATEVQTVTRLRHPQIPQVYAYIDDGDAVLIVMEYIAGTDLEQGLSTTRGDGTFLPGKPRPLPEVLRDGMVVCSILEHLHSRKSPVVHCDIKPANIIRDEESDALFLVDFGAAATVGAGENFGTPGYAPPELYRGQRMPASDIYALGATLYHLLTDDDPCDHPGQFPRLHQLPGPVMQVLSRTLDPDPALRPTAGALHQDLARCLDDPRKTLMMRFPTGAVPGNAVELAEAIRANWAYGLAALDDGTLDSWLRDHGLAAIAGWLVQTRQKVSAELALDELVRELDPATPPTEIRFGQQAIDIPPSSTPTAVPLKVVARGGMARISVISTPAWLQIAPPTLTLRPEIPEAFYMAVDLDRLPARQRAGQVVLEAAVGAGKLERFTLPATIADPAQHIMLRPGRPQSTRIAWLLGGWLVVALGSAFLIWMYPLSIGLIAQLAWGAAIGLLIAWLNNSSLTDWGVETSASSLGAVAGGTIIPLLISRNTANPLSISSLLLATIVAILASVGYIAFTE